MAPPTTLTRPRPGTARTPPDTREASRAGRPPGWGPGKGARSSCCQCLRRPERARSGSTLRASIEARKELKSGPHEVPSPRVTVVRPRRRRPDGVARPAGCPVRRERPAESDLRKGFQLPFLPLRAGGLGRAPSLRPAERAVSKPSLSGQTRGTCSPLGREKI